jgi:hypothetical protein
VVNIRLPYEPLYGKLLGVALHSRIGVPKNKDVIFGATWIMKKWKF